MFPCKCKRVRERVTYRVAGIAMVIYALFSKAGSSASGPEVADMASPPPGALATSAGAAGVSAVGSVMVGADVSASERLAARKSLCVVLRVTYPRAQLAWLLPQPLALRRQLVQLARSLEQQKYPL